MHSEEPQYILSEAPSLSSTSTDSTSTLSLSKFAPSSQPPAPAAPAARAWRFPSLGRRGGARRIRKPSTYRVAGQVRPGLLQRVRRREAGECFRCVVRPELGLVAVAVGRGYGTFGDEWVRRGLERVLGVVVTAMETGMESGFAVGVVALERLVEMAWVDAAVWVEGMKGSAESGFSGVVSVFWHGWMVVGGVGDGHVAVLRRGEGRSKGTFVATDVAEVHNVGNERERERVERFGGVVKQGRVLDEEDGRRALDVTRVLGCTAMRAVGVSQVPWVRGGLLTSKDKWVVLSTMPLVEKSGQGPLTYLGKLSKDKKGTGDVCKYLLDTVENGKPRMKDMTVVCVQMVW